LKLNQQVLFYCRPVGRSGLKAGATSDVCLCDEHFQVSISLLRSNWSAQKGIVCGRLSRNAPVLLRPSSLSMS